MPDDRTDVIKRILQAIDPDVDDYVGEIFAKVQEAFPSSSHEQAAVAADVFRQSVGKVPTHRLARSFEYKGPEFWTRVQLLQSVADAIPFEAEDVLAIDRSIPAEAYRDGFVGYYLRFVRTWSHRQPLAAKRLIQQVVSGKGGNERLLVPLLEGMTDAAKDVSIIREELADVLTVTKDSGASGHAAYVLSLVVQVDDGLCDIGTAIDAINEAAKAPVEQVCATAVRAAGLFVARGQPDVALREVLLRAARDSRPNVRLASVSALRYLMDSQQVEDLDVALEMLHNFADIPDSGQDGTISELSWSLYALAAKRPETAMSFLRSWIVTGDRKLPVWHSTRFLHVIANIPEPVIGSAAVEWIIGDRRLIPSALHLLTQERGTIEVPASTVKSLVPKELLIVLLVLAANDHDVATAKVLTSVVVGTLRRRDARNFAQQLYDSLHHVIVNYRDEGKVVLARLKGNRSAVSHTLRDRLTELHEAVSNALDVAASAPEFTPDLHRQDTYIRSARAFQRLVRSHDIDDPGRFIFSQLFARNEVYLLGGTSVIDHGNHDSATPLGHIEVTLALPRVSAADPDGEYVRRATLLRRAEELRQP